MYYLKEVETVVGMGQSVCVGRFIFFEGRLEFVTCMNNRDTW